MSAPLWVTELAAAFWAAAGVAEPFPRALRHAAVVAFPLTVKELPGLRFAAARDWLRRRGVERPLPVGDRPLRACLAVERGGGFIFLEADDPEDERRFSLAHELAHYLRDYWQPRRDAARAFGETILDVFDGLRPPTPAERMNALVRRVPVGFHTHLLGRDAEHAAAEREADLLAYELLAPAGEIPPGLRGDDLVRELRGRFGLPTAHAARYAALLRPGAPDDPLVARLAGNFRNPVGLPGRDRE